MASSTSARRPSWIGKYEVLDKIGEGGFAVVYKARDPFIKRLVAIKVCISEDMELRDRFYREAEIAGNLDHRNIVTVFDFGVDEGRPYLVQEYLSGEDLKAKIRRREPLPPAARLDILAQVAQGLAHAHAQGVLHRDVKPGNVRVLEDGAVKIMDFGIARLASAETVLTREGSILGTAGYLPPEQVLGREADARADVFSFGALAYELLTYESPFPGKTVSEILQQVLQSEPRPITELWRRCPSDLAALVHRCMEKDPAQRYADLRQVLEDLAPIVERLERRAARERGNVEGMSLDETVPVPVDLLRSAAAPPRRPGVAAPPAAGEMSPPPPLPEPPPASRESAEVPTLVRPSPGSPPSSPPSSPTPSPAPARQRTGGGIGAALAAAGRRLRRIPVPAGRRRWIAAGAVVLALAALAVVLARRPQASPVPAPPPSAASPAVPAAAAERGLLVVDARPWAEVRELRDGDGNLLPLPEQPYTPLALEVPPGRYRLSLAHPGAAAPAACAVEVSADAGGRCWVEPGVELEVVDYFRESGWWR